MMTREQAEAAVKAQGGNVRAAARALGIPRTTLQNMLKRPAGSAVQDKAEQVGRTLADFRREHDQTWKIRDGLKRLFNGGIIMTDAEFREAVSGNPSRWRAAADQSEFR